LFRGDPKEPLEHRIWIVDGRPFQIDVEDTGAQAHPSEGDGEATLERVPYLFVVRLVQGLELHGHRPIDERQREVG
jgi:hypothetical protein